MHGVGAGLSALSPGQWRSQKTMVEREVTAAPKPRHERWSTPGSSPGVFITDPNATSSVGLMRFARILEPRLHLHFVAVFVLFSVAGGLFAQDAPTELPELTEQSALDRIAALTAATDLDAALQNQLVETWRKTLAEVRTREAHRRVAADFVAARDEAPSRLEETRAQLALPPAQLDPFRMEGPAEELEAAAARAESALEEALKAVADLQAERNRRATRRTDIPKLIASARERIAALPAPGEPAVRSDLEGAQRTFQEAARAAIEAEIVALERERESYDARAELLAAREDLASRRLVEVEGAVQAHRQATATRRREARELSERQAESARRTAQDAHPTVRALVDANTQLIKESNTRAAAAERDAARLAELQRSLQGLAERKSRVLAKVERVGFTNAIAALLRRERALLPEASLARQELVARQERLTEIEGALLGLEDERAEFANLEHYVDLQVQAAAEVPSADALPALREALLEQTARRRALLDEAISVTGAYFDQLVDLDSAQRQLRTTAEEYALYIDERILWVRSTHRVAPSDLTDAAQALAQLLLPATWKDIAPAFALRAEAAPGEALGAAVLVLALVLVRPWARRRIRKLGELVKSTPDADLAQTLTAALLTLVIAALWPVALALAGRFLGPSAFEVPAAFAQSLSKLGLVLAPISLLLAMCQPLGLAEAHFRWPVASTRVARRNVTLFALIAVPCLLVSLLLDALDWEQSGASLGRFSLVVAYTALAVLVARVLRPKGAIMLGVTRSHPGGWLSRLAGVWFLVAFLMPVVLIVAALLGYQYAAARLGLELLSSWTLVLCLLLGHGLARRWLALERRQALLALAAQQAGAVGTTDEEGQVPGATVSDGDPLAAATAVGTELDLDSIDLQARNLLKAVVAFSLVVGVWLIWADTLPAFGALRRVPLWTTMVEVAPVATATPALLTAPALQAVDVSLADLLLSIAVLVLTFSTARNLPGLLDVVVFRRLPFGSSTAYALSTCARYLVSTIGLILAFQAVSIGWSKVQWLVAAMSLGLGFGLQEIFGNFVSGIILLFEQRIRVDDIVTVGEVSGKVMRIRVLATTVRDWDRKEFVVPNKELITGKLLNWTLSDQLNRIVIKIGVAYGSDTIRARDLLLRVARAHPLILDEPEPVATFDTFGESSLNLILRCFLPDLDNRLRAITELNEAIDRTFRDAGIEIAFPQRDLHLRTADAPIQVSSPEPQAPDLEG